MGDPLAGMHIEPITAVSYGHHCRLTAGWAPGESMNPQNKRTYRSLVAGRAPDESMIPRIIYMEDHW